MKAIFELNHLPHDLSIVDTLGFVDLVEEYSQISVRILVIIMSRFLNQDGVLIGI